MDQPSDFAKTNDLMNDSEIADIEFYEETTTPQTGGQDTYAKIQEKGNLRAEDLSDEIDLDYNVDVMDNEGSKRHRGLDTDFRQQFGGKNENLNYLDDYTSGQYNTNRLDSYEKDFFAIYNKARDYRQRIMDVDNKQHGGEEVKKKREVNKTLALMLELTAIMKASGKYPDIQQKHFMKISKLIVDDAKKQTGLEKVDEKVRDRALELVKNPDKYVTQFRNEQTLIKNTQSNYRNAPAANTRREKDILRSKSAFNDADTITDTKFTKLSDSVSNKNKNQPWRGNDGNYRDYAQANLWKDVPELRDRSSQRFSNDRNTDKNTDRNTDRDLDRYGNSTNTNDRNNGNSTNTNDRNNDNNTNTNDRNNGTTIDNSTSRKNRGVITSENSRRSNSRNSTENTKRKNIDRTDNTDKNTNDNMDRVRIFY